MALAIAAGVIVRLVEEGARLAIAAISSTLAAMSLSIYERVQPLEAAARSVASNSHVRRAPIVGQEARPAK
jgi:hypothetical protein